jgi:hypothetical protein
VNDHLPHRPDWNCIGCNASWPCFTKRRQLLAEYEGARASLGIYLVRCMADAAADLPERAAGLVYEQFLGWLRTPEGAPPMPAMPVRDRRWSINEHRW